jgi:hypothetical protein
MQNNGVTIRRDPVTLYPRRGRTIVYLAGALLFIAAGFWMARAPTEFDRVLGYAVAVFSGLCSAAFILMLLPGNSFLKLDEVGFTYGLLFRKKSRRWAEVSSFTSVNLGVGRPNMTVGWWLLPAYKNITGKLNRALVGCDEALPHIYGDKDSVELAQLMNEWAEDAQGSNSQ